MSFTSINNFRELGEIINKEGKKVKENILLRSAQLDILSKEDEETLVNKYKVKTIIDFRTNDEVEKAPDIVPNGIKYIHVSPLEDLVDEIKKSQQKNRFI